MKPSFALNLTEDGITLLHRTSRGWLDVGSVAFGDPDMGEALEYLRSTALGLDPDGMTTKLIIPESQILYLQVDAVGPDDTSRRAQIEAALDGRTPYALDELAYDWTANGSTVTVAVVARETLTEAEGFATEHRFNPVSFVACPEAGFDKEPFFGPSGLAQTLLANGDVVEADAVPVTIIARDMPRPDDRAKAAAEQPSQPVETDLPAPALPEPDVSDLPLPQPEPPQADLPEPDLREPEAPPADLPDQGALLPDLPEPSVPEAPAPQAQDPVLHESDGAGVGDTKSEWSASDAATPEPHVIAPESVVPGVVAPPEVPIVEPAATEFAPPNSPPPNSPPPNPQPAPAFASEQAPVRWPEPTPVQSAIPEPLTAVSDDAEAPMAVDVPLDDSGDDAPATRPASVLSEQTPPADDLVPRPSAAAMMAFASRRPAEGAARPLGAATQVRSDPDDARPAPLSATRPSAAKPLVERPASARPAPKFSYDDPVPPPVRLPGDPPTTPASVMGKAQKGLRSLGTLVTAPSIPGTRKKKPVVASAISGPASQVKPTAAAATLAPGATLTAPLDSSPVTASAKAASQSLARQKPVSPDALAKGLSARTMPQRGKPRYLGLILTGILLLLLAVVAAWSSFYLTRADDGSAETQLAALDDAELDEAFADGQLTDPEDALLTDLALDDLPVNVDLSDLQAEQPQDVSEDLALAVPPAAPAEPAPQTGVQDVVADATQPGPATQDEIFLASMDAPPALSDPLVLPAPAARGDAPPAAQMPPPPFGTVYQFDADGRIVPTAEGIMTPEGVLLVAGPPSVTPPPRPATIEAAALAPANVAEPAAVAPADTAAPAVDGTLLPAETFAADPALSAARPRLRPEGLAPATLSDDDASLAPAENSRFASLRPRLRPQAILAAGESARQASEAASLAVQVAVAEAAAVSADDASLSPMAVSVSRVPAPRPRDLSRAVEAAVAAATRRAEPEVVAAAAPAARSPAQADEADDEPEIAAPSAAPRIPTKANVAKQATFVNAINLSKTNLIGVYGTQSKRYALVRQPNGRYRKVRVGDNIDGGKVQAITASEVRYQKGGRMLALSMPQG